MLSVVEMNLSVLYLEFEFLTAAPQKVLSVFYLEALKVVASNLIASFYDYTIFSKKNYFCFVGKCP